ncbi:hypothetical protein RhiirB3_427121 [Rhizophagus irregularis]|nr:hypothetical protein RhiirB3_427121 [Rhizophagus irregularis]
MRLGKISRKFHPNNCIIPHIQQSSLNNIPEIQVKNFWNSLLLRIEKKLSYHRSGSGSRKIIFEPFSEELFVKIFSQEENFTFISYLNKYKYVFTGKLGYKRLGFLFDCEVWGEKKHNHDGKEPLTLNSPKLAVSFNILTGYFQDNNIDENCTSEGNSSLEMFVQFFLSLKLLFYW